MGLHLTGVLQHLMSKREGGRQGPWMRVCISVPNSKHPGPRDKEDSRSSASVEEAQALPRPRPWSLGQRVVCEHLGCRAMGTLSSRLPLLHKASMQLYYIPCDLDSPEVDVFEGRICKLRIVTSRAVTVKQVNIRGALVSLEHPTAWFSTLGTHRRTGVSRRGSSADPCTRQMLLQFQLIANTTNNERRCVSYNSSTRFLQNALLMVSYNPWTFL